MDDKKFSKIAFEIIDIFTEHDCIKGEADIILLNLLASHARTFRKEPKEGIKEFIDFFKNELDDLEYEEIIKS